MIEKQKSRQIKKIAKIILQSVFYLGSIVFMVYVGYSKSKDKDWLLIKEFQKSKGNSKNKRSGMSSDSTNSFFLQVVFEDISSNQIFDK